MSKKTNQVALAGRTRRDFLKLAAAAVAAPYVITSAALGANGRPPASDRIVMGGVGIGNQGSSDHGRFLGDNQVQYVAVCDVQQAKREKAKARVDAKYGDSSCAAYNDFRELLARPEIDAIHTACPDHWHALITVAACRAGKDVYCQKPLSLTIADGRAMVDAARRYSRVVSGGSQRVLDDSGGLARQCWSGDIGQVKEVYVEVGGPSKPCNLPGQPVPEGLDWDMWLGPAPYAPYHPYRISGSYNINGTCWRSWRDYSGGGMTDWGAHKFGGALFAVGLAHEGPVEVIPPDGKDVKLLTYVFANGIRMYHGSAPKGGGHSQAQITVFSTDEKTPAKPMPGYHGERDIHGDFLTCVRTRQRPFRDVEISHRTASVCHLGNIAYALKRPLKWDPVKEEFPGDEQANRFVSRAKRAPWSL
jgi:hypothetical protein